MKYYSKYHSNSKYYSKFSKKSQTKFLRGARSTLIDFIVNRTRIDKID